MDKTLKAIDLFAGCGSFSLGFKMAGFDVVVAVENDKWAAQTYRYNHKKTIVMEEDIQQITAERLLKTAHIHKRELDMLFGSPPCQGFSTMSSKRSIDDPRSKLMNEFVRLLRDVEPRMFMIENVPGMFYFKDFFRLLMETLEDCGYVVRCLMMDACSYGVPQYRKRIFIEGVRKDIGFLPIFPKPTNFDPSMLKQEKMFTRADVAIECFAENGFTKEEVKDLYWNTKLHIQMNRKTASFVVDRAIGTLIAKGIKRCLIKEE